MSKTICDDCFDNACEVCTRRNHPAGKKLNELVDRPLQGTGFDNYVVRLAESNVRLLLRKHDDYGPKNISQSPGGALNGLRVRMHDKLARINHLIDNDAEPQNESLYDSFMDLANYALIAQLVIRGEWPNE